MKTSRLVVPVSLLLLLAGLSADAQTMKTLNALATFGFNGDGSIRPGDQPWVSAPGGLGGLIGDLPSATNGFNQRGVSYDPVSGNLVYVDTHTGSGGGGFLSNNAAIYILDSSTGTVITNLDLTGIAGGSYTHVGAAVADDGVVYVCNQVTVSTNVSVPFRLYRWDSVNSTSPPTLAFSGNLAPTQRYGESLDIRGSGAGTEILIGSMPGTTATNVVLFTTADGTNFTANVIGCTNVTSANFNDGIAFGTNNTFWAKRIGAPLLYLSYDLTAKTARTLAVYNASSLPGYLNLGTIAVDNVNGLLAAVEQVGGTVSSGAERVWLFDITDPLRAPRALTYRDYVPNYQNATAPHAYADFGGGRLYVNVVNNGLLASTVDTVATPAPVILTDLPPTNRVALGQTAHFEVKAYPDITGYQWQTNGVNVPGATNFFLDVPNVQTSDSGRVYNVIVSNAASTLPSANSTLSVVNPADLFHLSLLWSFAANQTNYFTNPTGGGTPDARSLAYNAPSNQLIVVRRSGPVANNNMAIAVVDPDTGQFLYNMRTNGIALAGINIALLSVAVADDGAVYICNGTTAAQIAEFRVYRWADSGPDTYPTNIWTGNPAVGVTTAGFRWGDTLAARGAGTSTQILLDNTDAATFRFLALLRPSGADLNQAWTGKGYVLQNSSAITTIGHSLQFHGSGDYFMQKRTAISGNVAVGGPFTRSSFNPADPDPAIAPVDYGSTGGDLFTNGPAGFSAHLNLAAAVSFSGLLNGSTSTPDTLNLYDVTAPQSPVTLNRYNFGGNHVGNANAIGQVIFATNSFVGSPNFGTNLVFALDANNGIMALTLSSGPLPPPTITSQPQNQRIVQGTGFTLGVVFDSVVSAQWQKDSGVTFTNIPNATNNNFSIGSSQLGDAGNYRIVASHTGGSVTSVVANVYVALPRDNYSLTPIWSASSGIVTAGGPANSPNERSIAYHALSNQLLIVRGDVAGNPSTYVPIVRVLDADTGTQLHTLDVSGVFIGAESEVSGSNPLNLTSVAVAEDGNIYACNEVPNGSGGITANSPSKLFRVYRWTNSAPTTVALQIFAGDPANQTNNNVRWGDVLTVRGSGTNTEILLNDFAGFNAGILKPTDESLNTFTNYPISLGTGGGSIGRSLQFESASGTNFWQKRKGLALSLTGYNLDTQSSVLVSNFSNFALTLGAVAVDPLRKIAVGVDYVGNATTPDALALYDVSSLTAPMLVLRTNFPVTPQAANANFICSTVFGGNKVFSLNGNNGIVALAINGPQLSITPQGGDTVIAWPLFNGYTLQATPSLTPPAIWTNVGPGTVSGGDYVVTNSAAPGSLFYRLKL